MTTRIFCLGANKTGTTSLTKAMECLGYKTLPEQIAYKYQFDAGPARVINDLHGAPQYNFFQDIPFNLFENYKQFDKSFPDAKFILIIRNSESWWISVSNWYIKLKMPYIYEFIYGCQLVDKNKDFVIKQYEKRNQDIIEYFKDQPDKLLILKTEELDKWDDVCKFLNKETPNMSFPFENKSK